MSTQIDNVPIQTPIEFGEKVMGLLTQSTWVKWLQQIVTALFRPTLTTPIQFGLTPAQSSSDYVVQFPKNSIGSLDVPVLLSPVPPPNSTFTIHGGPSADQVVVRFNNYSAGPLSTGLPQNFTITVLKA